MKTSPRRPLILKRRKLPLPVQNAPGDTSEEEPKRPPAQQEPAQPQASKEVAESNPCKFPAGIKMINHPTMPNTQVVAVPKNANVQSIITALTAKGKESGSSGPNKFILISCGGAPTRPPGPQPQGQASNDPKRTEVITEALGPKSASKDVNLPRPAGALPGQRWENCAGGEAAGCTLDNSLTNIQWLGKMTSDGLGSCSIKQEAEEKENRHLERSQAKNAQVEGPLGASATWPDSVSERPPYSYMAMIQFAINSTERKRMTLKDIYTWIEDHFPYFKHIAKPGWKNSIRHNLSLHDMFVRETSANGKVSFWTIHPSANRYLTLDQVFKPLDPGSPQSPEHLESQQKRPNPELRRNVAIKTELPLGARAARGRGRRPSAHGRTSERGEAPPWRRAVSSASSPVHQGGRSAAWGGNATLRETHQSREPAPGRVALALPICQGGIVPLLGGFVPLPHPQAQEVLQRAQVPSPLRL
ncbi:forkhead box protein M1 isoform X2 [Pseudorca crassidens]|uniref:forkhead box protein M1 isoform X2 n=1 Tax=Pseudorca crassidens TaxID=82174 RepID=UPI00352E7BF3